MDERYTDPRHNQEKRDEHSNELVDHDGEKLDELVGERARNATNEHAEKLDEIRQETEAESRPADEVVAAHIEKEEPAAAPAGLINKELKSLKYNRTLQSVRKDLKPSERVLSKVIHNPAVDAVSQAAEKTVARPSGLLFGGIFAFVGSSAFLWISKHYGYEYNFLLFLLFFLGGFGVGLVLELLMRVLRRRA